MQKIKVYIVDDYFLIREGVKRSLILQEEIEIVGESNSLIELRSFIQLNQLDVLIFDIKLCFQPISKLIDDLKMVQPTIKFLVISDSDCELSLQLAIKAGVKSIVRKNISKDELIYAVKQVYQNKEYFVNEVAQIMLKGYINDQHSSHIFSERESEILKYICKGRSNEQIADLLFLSEKTILTHRRNIMKKAGVKKSTDLIIWAIENKIISRD